MACGWLAPSHKAVLHDYQVLWPGSLSPPAMIVKFVSKQACFGGLSGRCKRGGAMDTRTSS